MGKASTIIVFFEYTLESHWKYQSNPEQLKGRWLGVRKGSGVMSPRHGQGVCHLLPALAPPSLSFSAALRACKIISIHLVQFYIS